MTDANQVPVLQTTYGIPPDVSAAYMSGITSGSPPPSNLTSDQTSALVYSTSYSFERGLSMLFIALAPLGVIGWIASMFLKHIPLQTKAVGFQ